MKSEEIFTVAPYRQEHRNTNPRIKLGERVRCLVTGASGVVTGRSEYLYDNTLVRVQPSVIGENGAPTPAFWIPECQTEPEPLTLTTYGLHPPEIKGREP